MGTHDSIEQLRLLAFCVYLVSWLVLAGAAVASAIPRRRQAAAPIHLTTPAIVGTLLQAASALPITLFLNPGPLRPDAVALCATLVLTPFAAALFSWAVWSAPRANTLATGGAYARLRHPMYLAFLAMLLATGLLASAGLKLILAAGLYITGSEMRIASEEAELERRFPQEYPQYRAKTRWRYLPGLR